MSDKHGVVSPELTFLLDELRLREQLEGQERVIYDAIRRINALRAELAESQRRLEMADQLLGIQRRETEKLQDELARLRITTA